MKLWSQRGQRSQLRELWDLRPDHREGLLGLRLDSTAYWGQRSQLGELRYLGSDQGLLGLLDLHLLLHHGLGLRLDHVKRIHLLLLDPGVVWVEARGCRRFALFSLLSHFGFHSMIALSHGRCCSVGRL